MALSQRIIRTDPAIIEEIFDKYRNIDPPPISLAQGVSYWDPPSVAVEAILDGTLTHRDTHRYGSVLGLDSLRVALKNKHRDEYNMNMNGFEIMICAGANQAFMNVVLALLDPGDKVILPSPYYFSHHCALQLAGASIDICGFERTSLLPDMNDLRSRFHGVKPKAIVITNPGNPSGAVYPKEIIDEIVGLCKMHGTWLVVDEVYQEFVHDDAHHYSPCGNSLGMENIIHIHSFSKTYGLAGWRIGYIIFPSRITEHMLKVQDTIPTHPSIASQKVALAAMSCEKAWVRNNIKSLGQCRMMLFEEVRFLETAYTKGAIYFLIPLPGNVPENHAIDVLAKTYGVLVTPGSAFGAFGHVRVSYASLPPDICLEAFRRLGSGLRALSQEATSTSNLEDKHCDAMK